MKKHPNYPNLFVLDHPLILHKLTLMRDKNCPKALFRALMREVGMLMGYEITRPLPMTEKEIETPICKMQAPIIDGKKPVIVPILRAALGMADGLEELMPSARVGHIGVYRDPETKMPKEYLVKLPDLQERMVFLVDPLLATGGSAKHAIDVLMQNGAAPGRTRFLSMIAAPEGVSLLQKEYPDIPIYVAALDSHLNEKKYIIPGIGDSGDRLYGTK